jgi:hypothetical protein
VAAPAKIAQDLADSGALVNGDDDVRPHRLAGPALIVDALPGPVRANGSVVHQVGV